MWPSLLSVFSGMDSTGWNSLDGLRLEQRMASTEIFTDRQERTGFSTYVDVLGV